MFPETSSLTIFVDLNSIWLEILPYSVALLIPSHLATSCAGTNRSPTSAYGTPLNESTPLCVTEPPSFPARGNVDDISLINENRLFAFLLIQTHARNADDIHLSVRVPVRVARAGGKGNQVRLGEVLFAVERDEVVQMCLARKIRRHIRAEIKLAVALVLVTCGGGLGACAARQTERKKRGTECHCAEKRSCFFLSVSSYFFIFHLSKLALAFPSFSAPTILCGLYAPSSAATSSAVSVKSTARTASSK